MKPVPVVVLVPAEATTTGRLSEGGAAGVDGGELEV